jgi:hypothetical protein
MKFFLPLVTATQIIQGENKHGDDLWLAMNSILSFELLRAEEAYQASEYL